LGALRKRYSAEFKARAALEALKGQRLCNEIAADLGVHPTMLAQWKKHATEGLADLFVTGRSDTDKARAALVQQLYEQIGQQKVELDWLKKKSGVFRV
jgi:transposase-like protein